MSSLAKIPSQFSTAGATGLSHWLPNSILAVMPGFQILKSASKRAAPAKYHGLGPSRSVAALTLSPASRTHRGSSSRKTQPGTFTRSEPPIPM